MMQASMHFEGFPVPKWDERRRPLASQAADAMRRRRYWAWSNATDFDEGGARLLAPAEDGRAWFRLETRDQADFEAKHMQHSIGYNWDHYSGMGQILSLRTSLGTPEMTVLVAGGHISHARRAENGPPSRNDLTELRSLADRMGWTMPSADIL